MKIPEDFIPAIAFVFEKARHVALSSHELEEITHYGFESVTPEILAHELLTLITDDGEGNCHYRSSCYWALGKKHDSSLIPFFRKQLGIELSRDPDSVYQILIALDNLGESCFGKHRAGSFSALEKELNRQDAEVYLQLFT